MKEKRLPVKQLGIQDWRESQSEKDCTSFLKNERQTDVLSCPNSCHSLQKNVLMEEGREIRQEKVKVSVSPLCPFQTKQKLFFFFLQTKRPPNPSWQPAPHENALALFLFAIQGVGGFVVSVVSSKRKQTICVSFMVSFMLFTFLSVSSSSASSTSCTML